MAIPTLSKRPKCFGPIFVDVLIFPIYRLNKNLPVRCSRVLLDVLRGPRNPRLANICSISLSTLNRAKVVGKR
jgi:hypothetical protein